MKLQPDMTIHDAALSNPVPMLTVQNLTKIFPQQGKKPLTAVNSVSFSVSKGEFIVIIGPSGCGKTTLLRMIAGFEKATSGHIRFQDKDVTRQGAEVRQIPMVFQNYALFPHMNVWENITYGLSARNLPEDVIYHDTTMICHMLNISGLESKYPRELSDGQQQRVALARALVLKPDVLLFDEPLSNLDVRLRIQTRTEIKRMQQVMGITVIYVTHDQTEALSLPNRIFVMDRGQIVQVGTPVEVYHHPATPFVADFISHVNFVDAVIRPVSGKKEVLVQSNLFSCTMSRPENMAQINEDMQGLVAINPVSIKVNNSDALDVDPDMISLRGKVEQSQFTGPFIEYSIQVGKNIIRVIQPNILGDIASYPLGTDVTLTIAPSSLRLFLQDGIS